MENEITLNLELWVRNCPSCNKELKYKSYSAWHLATKNNSLCRNCSTRKYALRCADLSILLEDTPETFYWIGFLLADGSFSDNRLKFSLRKEDADQVHKLGEYIKYTGSYGVSDIEEYLSCKDIDIVTKNKRKKIWDCR